MAKQISEQDILKLKEEILAGKIFIYPTDTIYGIGCDALNQVCVEKIRVIKNRDSKPFSVIAPSFDWIKENFEFDYDIKQFLPGPYTLLLKKKNKEFLKWISDNDRVGIRIPDHSFTSEIQKARVPFVTTSVNISGKPFLLNLEDLDPSIEREVDYIIISDKELSGKPSILIIDGQVMERK